MGICRAASRRNCLIYALAISTFCLSTAVLFIVLPERNVPEAPNRRRQEISADGAKQKRNSNRLTATGVIDLVNLEQSDPIEDIDSCPRWYKLASQLKKCYVNRFARISNDSQFWSQISPISVECGADLLRNLLHTKYLVNKDDVKVVIPPLKRDDACVSVTVGIGNDTFAETRLSKLVSQLTLFGADPIRQSGVVFEKLGRFEQVAVAAKAGRNNASVLENGKYSWSEVEAITLGDLLQQRFKQSLIDYLFLDVEGSEYDILPQLAHEMQVRKVTICQINVELHGPLNKYGFEHMAFARVLKRLFSPGSPYLPLWIPKPTLHHRFFLVDWKSPYCSRKFYATWC